MKRVYEYIGARSVAFAERPLFRYLRDSNVQPARRLAFVPFMTHFVMTFADLYNLVLPENPPRDRYDELTNAHLAEDATHWKWFLADLTNASLDPKLSFTDALRFIWSDATVETRLLSYRICQMSAGMSSIAKLVMVNCIEATGKVGLEALAVAGSHLERAIGRKLVYFGTHHVDTEADHTLEEASVRSSLERLVMDEVERKSMCSVVDTMFQLFENSVDEMYRAAEGGREFRDGTGLPNR
jgi:hypothetical protein